MCRLDLSFYIISCMFIALTASLILKAACSLLVICMQVKPWNSGGLNLRSILINLQVALTFEREKPSQFHLQVTP